jgi:hypothetical protein
MAKLVSDRRLIQVIRRPARFWDMHELLFHRQRPVTPG